MKTSHWMMIPVVAFTLLSVGCNQSDTASNVESAGTSSQYIIDSEPEDAIGVGEAKQSAENEQAITLVGTIGGSSAPFVDGIAAFTIVDSKVPYCAADEGCPTPWDYCCTQEQVKDNIATIKVVDEAGNPVSQDARELLGVKELSTVVIQGKAKRDDQGNLTVAASEVFVKK
ncbi:hypothetical protein SAMN06265222_108157 [Neorhodopirellula lusitana]|uniref:Uncharacterized protein n=1 Tax=Neorhodopirellula lusitana TaxID=445327 RepID=A0ABY1QDA8_9BACT|nr:hypothetical protein [Neorhodopirellula lusitana]SMP63953.1 hypothetical protein SAMN06265222_108157 [Neorhodopirellula lusitana]